VTGSTTSIPALSAAGTVGTSTATCATGKVLLGGGAHVTNSGTTIAAVLDSYPASTTQWTAQGEIVVSGTGAVTVTAYALCSP
jgi:hypothetical protein